MVTDNFTDDGALLLLHYRPRCFAPGPADTPTAAIVLREDNLRLRNLVDHAGKATPVMATHIEGVAVDAIDFVDFAMQILRGNPRWCTALLDDDDTFVHHASPSWLALVADIRGLLPGAIFLKSCTHQASGLLRGLAKDPKAADPGVATARWTLIAELLEISARCAGLPSSSLPADLLESTLRTPSDAPPAVFELWQQLCERQTEHARLAQSSEPGRARDDAISRLECWLEATRPPVSAEPTLQAPAGSASAPMPTVVPPELAELHAVLGAPRPAEHCIHAVQCGSKMCTTGSPSNPSERLSAGVTTLRFCKQTSTRHAAQF